MDQEESSWIHIYNAVVAMRVNLLAPVDVAGPHVLATATDEEARRFQILVALILSSQTRDQMVSDTMKTLEDNIEGGCTPRSLLNTPEDDIKEMIKKVSFSNRKAGFIRGTAEMILSQYNGRVPTETRELLKLPGVGNKVASVFISCTSENEEVSSIGVDTHLTRIFRRWNWVPSTIATPNAIARSVQKWLPRPLWKDINQIVVGFGQTICTARNPLCASCLVRHWCPGREEIARDSSPDMEDMERLYGQTQKAYEKLVDEYGLPEAEVQWIVPNGDVFALVSTKWLEE